MNECIDLRSRHVIKRIIEGSFSHWLRHCRGRGEGQRGCLNRSGLVCSAEPLVDLTLNLASTF